MELLIRHPYGVIGTRHEGFRPWRDIVGLVLDRPQMTISCVCPVSDGDRETLSPALVSSAAASVWSRQRGKSEASESAPHKEDEQNGVAVSPVGVRREEVTKATHGEIVRVQLGG
ncbi:hypothetical protein NDU88_005527 [Pleurodeles waltl]|uniref:Uncharacterized protein n=1 Tax=Pleurodeles waltl TaxID=8319 RepID=A0AAV7PMX5_PLEWA|nr:hypothetical protein NDU88_005527 [Pleurodeles waltl]